MLVLSRSDIQALVPMSNAIELVKSALRSLSLGEALAPLRTVLDVQPGTASALFMPAYVPSVEALGLKVVSVFRENPARGLPTITSVVMILDPSTGVPLATMDGGYLTALRTGAGSGVATDLLARADSSCLVVIGAGAQALTQAAAVDAVRSLDRIIVVVRSPERFVAFRTRIEDEWPALASRLEPGLDADAAVAEADVICCATTSVQPVFDPGTVKPGTHINGVGSYTAAMQEVPGETVRSALLVVDQRAAALEEAGDLVIPIRAGMFEEDHIHGELGELVAGNIAGRISADQVTFFKSVGNAVQDMAVGRFAFDEAVRRRVGVTVEMG